MSGCGTERALLAQRKHPELRKLLNAGSNLFLTEEYSAAVEKTCRDALEASCFGLNIHYQLVRMELLERAAHYGLPVYVWTIDEEVMMERFVNMGVASITTRNVETLVRLKQKKSREARS
ncbi:glycerophosphodiester phosphodiesterase [Paenibacillus caui]|uniref:glycerophosphodiester phosphodiesterase n=1 Tax=Paenibacillus caui TaxID=2873927 RepID=UPI001CA84351|nr:glycerophosphodiester phosphodiesterase family protein [Paenibacillus caui]